VAVPYLPRQYWEALGAPEAPPQRPWPLPVVLQLGKQLAEVLVQAVQMPRNLAAPQGACRLIPVLYHVYSFRSFRQVGGATGQGGSRTSEGATETPRLCWTEVLSLQPWGHLLGWRIQSGVRNAVCLLGALDFSGQLLFHHSHLLGWVI
jgi:hypothetical protein